MAKSIKHTAKAKKDIENPKVFKSRKSNDFPQLTVKEILELLEALEKGEVKTSKDAKKLADVFGMSLDELLKSSKKDLREKAQEYELKFTPVKKPEDSPKSLLEHVENQGLFKITDDGPKDLQIKKGDYEIDDDYANPNKAYQDKQYNLQGNEERETKFSYFTSEKKKKKTLQSV